MTITFHAKPTLFMARIARPEMSISHQRIPCTAALGRDTTDAEIDRVVAAFPPLMERLRALAAPMAAQG